MGVMGAGRPGKVIDLEDSQCGDYYTDGMFYLDSRTRIADIRDGTSNTLAIGERIYQLRTWTKGAYYVGSLEEKVCIFTSKNIRWPMNSDTDVLYYIGNNKENSCLFNDLYFGSRHPGGAQFCFADGSVHFIGETINLDVYRNMATIAGGEVNTTFE